MAPGVYHRDLNAGQFVLPNIANNFVALGSGSGSEFAFEPGFESGSGTGFESGSGLKSGPIPQNFEAQNFQKPKRIAFVQPLGIDRGTAAAPRIIRSEKNADGATKN